VNSCQGNEACASAGGKGGSIGTIGDSCKDGEYACSYLAYSRYTANTVGDVLESCIGDRACNNGGSILEIMNACNGTAACERVGYEGFVGGIWCSCNADDACTDAGSLSYGNITSGINSCCNNAWECRYADETSLSDECTRANAAKSGKVGKSSKACSVSVGEPYNASSVAPSSSVHPSISPSSSPSISPSLSPSLSLSPSSSVFPTLYCAGAYGVISILTDKDPTETRWTLSRVTTGSLTKEIVLEGDPDSSFKLFTNVTCLDDGDYVFIIYDDYGDGICCAGYYEITVGGKIVARGGAEFGAEETIEFSVPFTKEQIGATGEAAGHGQSKVVNGSDDREQIDDGRDDREQIDHVDEAADEAIDGGGHKGKAADKATDKTPHEACRDNYRGCKAWASRGECENSPEKMLTACPLSCDVCLH